MKVRRILEKNRHTRRPVVLNLLSLLCIVAIAGVVVWKNMPCCHEVNTWLVLGLLALLPIVNIAIILTLNRSREASASPTAKVLDALLLD